MQGAAHLRSLLRIARDSHCGEREEYGKRGECCWLSNERVYCKQQARNLEQMVQANSSLWQTIGSIAEAEGVQLFDIDIPGERAGGVLRVYITKELGQGVSFDDCVRVSKCILDLDETEELIPSGCSLEVSSPGVNRRLRLEQHFVDATGERIRVKYRDESSDKFIVVFGTVESFQEGIVTLVSDDKEEMKIPFVSIKEARVDFKF